MTSNIQPTGSYTIMVYVIKHSSKKKKKKLRVWIYKDTPPSLEKKGRGCLILVPQGEALAQVWSLGLEAVCHYSVL